MGNCNRSLGFQDKIMCENAINERVENQQLPTFTHGPAVCVYYCSLKGKHFFFPFSLSSGHFVNEAEYIKGTSNPPRSANIWFRIFSASGLRPESATCGGRGRKN